MFRYWRASPSHAIESDPDAVMSPRESYAAPPPVIRLVAGSIWMTLEPFEVRFPHRSYPKAFEAPPYVAEISRARES